MSEPIKKCKSCNQTTTNPLYCSECSERVEFICQERKNREGKAKSTDFAYGKNLLKFPPRKISEDKIERFFCIACKRTIVKTKIGKHSCPQMREKTCDE